MTLLGLGLAGVASAASLDTGFGDGGTVITRTGTPPIAENLSDNLMGGVGALAEDSQGRLIAAGGTGSKSLVIRYLPDGSLDPSFGVGGKAMFGAVLRPDRRDWTANRINAIALYEDGRILLAGEESDFSRPSRVFSSRYFLRLMPDGSPDPSFANFPNYLGGPPPLVVMPEPNLDVGDLQLQPDGRILWSGSYTDSFDGENRRVAHVTRNIAELPSDPTKSRSLHRDRTFARDTARWGWGVQDIFPKKWPFWNAFNQIDLLPSGKILVGGNLRNRFFVGRLTKAGEWDRSFGKARNGMVISEIKNDKGKSCLCAVGTGMDRDRQGRIVLAGWSFPSGRQRDLNLLRFTPGGRPDRSFSRDGKAKLTLNQYVTVRKVVIHPNGRIFVAAWLGYQTAKKFAVFAFKPNGEPLRSFFKNGRYIDPNGETSTAEDVLIDRRGRLVVSGGLFTDGDGNFEDGDASFVIKRFKVG